MRQKLASCGVMWGSDSSLSAVQPYANRGWKRFWEAMHLQSRAAAVPLLTQHLHDIIKRKFKSGLGGASLCTLSFIFISCYASIMNLCLAIKKWVLHCPERLHQVSKQVSGHIPDSPNVCFQFLFPQLIGIGNWGINGSLSAWYCRVLQRVDAHASANAAPEIPEPSSLKGRKNRKSFSQQRRIGNGGCCIFGGNDFWDWIDDNLLSRMEPSRDGNPKEPIDIEAKKQDC